MQTEFAIVHAQATNTLVYLHENKRNHKERRCRIGKITRKAPDPRRFGWFGSSEGIEAFYRRDTGQRPPSFFRAVAG